MEVNTNYVYQVRHSINYKLFDKIYDAVSTYKVELEKLAHYNFRIVLKRSDFKVNDKKIKLKFEKIAYAYNKTLFPIVFEVKDGNFALANYNEISKNLELKDAELKLKHEGPGFDFIREGFFQKVAKDGYVMAEYVYSFGLIRIILLNLEKIENNKNYHFNWQVLPLECKVFWKGEKKFDSELNVFKYEGESKDNLKLFDVIKTAGTAYHYPDKVTDEESEIATTIKHETQYNTTELDFNTSETEIRISNSYFNYEENLILTRKK